MRQLRSIHVSDLARSRIGPGLLDVLENLMPVRFSSGEGPAALCELRIQAPQDASEGHRSGNTSDLVLPPSIDTATGAGSEVELSFSDDAEVPFPFRGRVVRTIVGAGSGPLALRPQDKPLAFTAEGAIWSVRDTGSSKHFRSALPLPRLSARQGFADAFHGRDFMHALPLLHFLGQAIGANARRSAPLRAAFIVDDPNLHWPRYGFVDFREMARCAARENYHVAFGMIPIDTWFTHRATAELFRQSTQHLSLLVHGNNHGRDELAQPRSGAARIALLRQALERVESFERAVGLRVCRVMVPPHGACSSEMLATLPLLGFEAACISAGSLRSHNPQCGWTRTLGFAPSEFIEGCPVLPRWALSASVKNDLLVAAYLGQPMIVRAHHQDVRGGPEVFDSLARFINGLGVVRWSNLGGVCRLNYCSHLDGTTLHVNSLGRTVEVVVPSQATEMRIDEPDAASRVEWRVGVSGGAAQKLSSGAAFDLTGLDGRSIVIERMAPPPHHYESVTAPRTSARLVLRRLLTEARDRLLVN